MKRFFPRLSLNRVLKLRALKRAGFGGVLLVAVVAGVVVFGGIGAKAQLDPPLFLIVNSFGDAADVNVGDTICDTDALAAGEQCTLRAAIQEANAFQVVGADTIIFDAALNLGTISLNSALPDIATHLHIVGPGAKLLRVQRSTAPATPNFRVLKIRPDIGPSVTVTVSGLTISNGNVVGPNSATNIGGGIMNRGTLTIDSCVVTGNQANVGGGVYSLGALTVLRSTISNNTATEGAGGIMNAFGDGSSSLRIDGSTISNNVSADQGGGLINGGSTVSLITNTTISSNTAVQGAGLTNFNNLQLNGVTITANNASNNGGGIRNSGPLLFTNTILAGNTAPAGTDGFGIDFFSLDFNLIGNTSGMQVSGAVSHNITNVNARLGPLADNGGLTRTHELLDGSPAIDAGFSSTLTDQRGLPRSVDNPAVANASGSDASDIGAYETPVFEVNSTADTDDGACTLSGTGNGCTLREAINAANTATGSEVITFKTSLTSSGPATITLLSALADLSNMTIDGPGADLLTVRRSSAGGTPSFRIFTVHRGRTVSLSNVTIANGHLPGDNGGGVFNGGSLTMTNCNVYGNAVGFPNQNGLGGGIHQDEGSLTLVNCNIGGLGPGQANTSGASGGGIFHSRGTLVMTGGSIVGNSAGGIFASLGTVTLNGVTISDNTTGNVGGGVWAGAAMKIINCLILNNTAGSFGGGIHATANTPTLVINTTISGNKSLNGGGGGIDQFNGFIELINSTVTNNRSSNFGGGIDAGGMSLRNTIVAGNFRGSGTIPDDLKGLVNSNSANNFIGVGTDITGITNGSNGNQIGTGASPLDAMLGPLADNGGPTLSHAPLPGSPVLDAGNNAFVVSPSFSGPPFTDQRGASFSRIVDGPDADGTATVDIGAVEQQVPLAAIADASTNEDTEVVIPFHIGDRSGITSITATSSNKKLVPSDASHLRLVEAGSTELIIVKPSENLVGTTEITVIINSSGGGSTNRTFVVTVNPVNDAPSFERQRATSSLEDIGPISVANFATNLSPGPSDEAAQTLSFQVTNNDNPGLFAAGPAISPSGTLTYTSAPDANGSANITVVLKDNGGTANGGKDTSTPQTFTITIRPVNDSPVNILPAIVSVNENSTVTFSTANSTRVATSDVDAGNAVVQVALTVSNGVLSLSGTTGLTFIAGDGTSDATMTFKGTIVNINTALNGMVYAPDKGFSGFANFQITTDDLGASGEGSSFPDTDFVTIAVLDGGMLQYPSSIFAVNEDVGNASVIALRVGGMAGATSVNFATANGTATGGATCGAGVDYISTSGTLSWIDGQQGIKSFSVTICDDAVNEELETVNLTLSAVTGSGELGTPVTAELRIANNDEPVLLTEGVQRAIALDSVIQTRDPFSLTNIFNFSNDQRRRISLFVWRLQLLSTDTPANLKVTAEDSEGRTYPLTVEHAAFLTNPSDVVQVIVRLPEQVVGAPRDLGITVQLRGPASNKAFIKIAAP